MKKIGTFLVCLVCLRAISQQADMTFHGDTWVAPYTLRLPNGWGYERFLLPPEFASRMAFKGVEDLRFTPNWGDSKSDQYWTYAYLWYLDNKPIVNRRILEKNLKAYYSGLVNRNILKREIPKEKIVPTITSIKKIKTYQGDLHTFSGTIDMLDYMAQQPMRLYCIVHVKNYKEANRFFLFFDVSPKPMNDKIWKDLEGLWEHFNAAKNLEIN
jgi:hypothetical protein